VPGPEQLALVRVLKQHAQAHPRSSIYAPKPRTDKAIALPNGCFATYANPSLLRGLDKEGKNEESQKHHRLMARTLNAVEECFQRGEDFDITVDDGRPIKGYRRVVRLSEKE
jgi:hypothetical protein